MAKMIKVINTIKVINEFGLSARLPTANNLASHSPNLVRLCLDFDSARILGSLVLSLPQLRKVVL
jgi:hypothetical protein